MKHDIVVIGASYGGVQAVTYICKNLPKSFPAAVFVVIHVPRDVTSFLPTILNRSNSLPAFHALDGASVQAGNVYIAPPDHHLLLKKGLMRVVRGPTENRHRPAIDPLFRSAALAYGPRVIGLVLTGFLDDGTAGLAAIKRRGGIAIAQNPSNASEPSMPKNAIENVDVDYIAQLQEMPALLQRLVEEPAPDERQFPVPAEMEKEVKIEEADMDALNKDEYRIGEPSAFSCPECGGVLWEIKDGDLMRFRCRVGHAFSMDSIQAEHKESLETALWSALKTLEENAALMRRLATRAKAKGMMFSVDSYESQMRRAQERADIIRRVLLSSKDTQSEEDSSPQPQRGNAMDGTPDTESAHTGAEEAT